MNITSENLEVDSYRSALMKEGVAVTRVAFSCKTIKYNRHGKVCSLVSTLLFLQRG